jgi:hypothetical protein
MTLQKRTLCIGSNIEDTDIKTKYLSLKAGEVCHGLLSELDQPLSHDDYSNPGFYHSSLADIEFGRLLDLMNQFDQVIILDQPIEKYGHPDLFYKTLQIASKTKTPVKFINPNSSKIFDYFTKLLEENKSFCIFPFIELLVNYDFTTVCCRSNQPVTEIKNLKDFKSDSNYQDIRKKMLAGVPIPEHCSFCYDLESQNITSGLRYWVTFRM